MEVITITVPVEVITARKPQMKLSDKDEGKRGVNKAGKKVGMVSQVEGNRVHIDPDPGITDTIRSKLGWGDADQDDYALEENRIHTITDDEIRLMDDL